MQKLYTLKNVSSDFHLDSLKGDVFNSFRVTCMSELNNAFVPQKVSQF